MVINTNIACMVQTDGMLRNLDAIFDCIDSDYVKFRQDDRSGSLMSTMANQMKAFSQRRSCLPGCQTDYSP